MAADRRVGAVAEPYEGEEPLVDTMENHPEQKQYKGFKSFAGKSRVSFCLSAILPYLIAIYLFVIGKISVSDMVMLFSALALFSILSGFMLIRKSANQLEWLAKKTSMISNGEKESLNIDGDQELKDIAKHFNAIVGKMNSSEREMRQQSVQLMVYAKDLSQSYQKAKKEEQLRNKISRYVGENLVEKLADEKGGELFENEKRELTILFADIRSFTSIAERLPAEELVTLLNDFFDVMTEIIFKKNGVLDKFVGDQIVAVFGLLPTHTGAEHDAVKTAIEMQKATEKLMASWEKEGKTTFTIGIGINTGNVLVGNVGSKTRMDYTVMGDCVNISARLQQLAKPSEIIIGQKTYSQIKEIFTTDQQLRVKVKNKSEPLECYRIPVPV